MIRLYKAKAYRKVKGKIVCQLCWRFCKIEDVGWCGVRVAKGNELYTLTYGNLSAMESRPMEIKPFFHFLPGRTAITFSTYSCNLDCPWCQNWHISKMAPPQVYKLVKPEEVVEKAILYGDIATCASFNEPTLLFEYLLDLFPIAKSKGLYNTMVSNGYITPLALNILKKAGLDAMNIDIKGDEEVYERYCKGKAKFVWRTAEKAKKLGIHIEMVNLLITDVNDDEDCVRWVVENHIRRVGEKVPLHFTRYHPAYLFDKPPTPVERIERAVEIAKREGVEFVYIGNVPGHKYENTYCPNCGELLIKRYSYRVLDVRLKGNRCWRCGKEIYGYFI
ncbi:AmmeMemoRadiSam system radical SAM enzyme [Archaeoglobus sp.]